MKVKMLENGIYSYDGNEAIKCYKGKTYETIADSKAEREENQIHAFVAKQFIDRKIAKEVKPRAKK